MSSPESQATVWRFHSRGPEETRRAGQRLGEVLRGSGMVVSLVGTLGAGKTLFVKGLAEGMEIDPQQVASPTFGIVNEYAGPYALAHADLYRVESEAELENSGFVDLLEPGTVVAVEWADRFSEALPRKRLALQFTVGEDPSERAIEITAVGEEAERALARFRERMKEEPGRKRDAQTSRER